MQLTSNKDSCHLECFFVISKTFQDDKGMLVISALDGFLFVCRGRYGRIYSRQV